VTKEELAQLRDALDIAQALPKSIRELLMKLLEAAKAKESEENESAGAPELDPKPTHAAGEEPSPT
jgi:hypothetical protein